MVRWLALLSVALLSFGFFWRQRHVTRPPAPPPPRVPGTQVATFALG
jgi:hypothetical protein